MLLRAGVTMTTSVLGKFARILSSNIVVFLTGLLATPVITRILGPSEYGVYAFLLSALAVLALMADGGIFDGIRKYMAENNRPPEWKNHVVAFYTRVAVVFIALLATAIFLAIEFDLLVRYFGPEYDLYFATIAGVVTAKQVGAITRGSLMGLDLESVSESLKILNNLIFIGLGLTLLVMGYGILGLLFGKIVGYLTMATLGGAVLSRHLDASWLVRRLPNSFPARELLEFNVGSLVLFGLYLSILHADILMLEWFRSSSETGIYRAALTFAEFLWFVPRIIQITLLHSTSTLWSDSKYERITDISARTTRYTLAFTLLLVIGLAALAEPAVTLYFGPDFAAAAGPLLILLPGALGFAVARPIFAIGQGNADLRPLNYATGGAAGINLVGNFLLIPQYGMYGAAVATSVGYLSMLVFHVWSARTIGFNPAVDLRLHRVGLTALLSGGAIFLLTTWITTDVYALLVVPPVGFAVYVGLSVATGVVEFNELTSVLQSARS